MFRNIMKRSVPLNLILCFIGVVYGQDPMCTGRDQCSCVTADGKVIDLSSVGHADGTAAFTDIQAPDGYMYSYNPCFPFTELACADQSACQVPVDRSSSYPAGDASSALFSNDCLNNHVTYTATDGIGTTRTTDVTLVCEPNADVASLTAIGEQGSSVYMLALTTKCACPDGCAMSAMTTTMKTTREKTTLPSITTKNEHTQTVTTLPSITTGNETTQTVTTLPSITTVTETTREVTTQPMSVGRCTGRYGCSCQTENGEIIDLSSIGNTDNTARFRNIPSKDGFLYSYNPCYPFNQLDCINAAVCIETLDQEISYVTGDYSTATFEFDGSINHLVYWAPGEHDIDRKTDIALVCDPEASTPKLEVIGEKQTQEYFLVLTTKCACPGGCTDHRSHQSNTASSPRFSRIVLFILAFVWLNQR